MQFSQRMLPLFPDSALFTAHLASLTDSLRYASQQSRSRTRSCWCRRVFCIHVFCVGSVCDLYCQARCRSTGAAGGLRCAAAGGVCDDAGGSAVPAVAAIPPDGEALHAAAGDAGCWHRPLAVSTPRLVSCAGTRPSPRFVITPRVSVVAVCPTAMRLRVRWRTWTSLTTACRCPLCSCRPLRLRYGCLLVCRRGHRRVACRTLAVAVSVSALVDAAAAA